MATKRLTKRSDHPTGVEIVSFLGRVFLVLSPLEFSFEAVITDFSLFLGRQADDGVPTSARESVDSNNCP